MHPRRFVALLLCTAALGARAAVTVTYGDPDRFTDAGDRNNDPVKVAQELADRLRKLGDEIAPAADIRIEILDIDRAGRPRMNLPTEERVVTGKADPPCIDLRYQFAAPGMAEAVSRERVCDRDFLRRLEPRYNEHDPLVYEKRMLDEWFRARFGKNTAR